MSSIVFQAVSYVGIATAFFCAGMTFQNKTPTCEPMNLGAVSVGGKEIRDDTGTRWYVFSVQEVGKIRYASLFSVPPGFVYDPKTRILQEANP